jgi:hypothetical protein
LIILTGVLSALYENSCQYLRSGIFNPSTLREIPICIETSLGLVPALDSNDLFGIRLLFNSHLSHFLEVKVHTAESRRTGIEDWYERCYIAFVKNHASNITTYRVTQSDDPAATAWLPHRLDFAAITHGCFDYDGLLGE